MERNRRYCEQCRTEIVQRQIEDRLRDYCPSCDRVFYDNPLPVASAVVVNQQREVLLVLRDREPHTGQWALPAGFAELNETIEESALRELREETGISGAVTRLLDICSHTDEFYGDLLWVSYEVNWLDGELSPGDDARDAGFFAFDALPSLAFPSHAEALEVYQRIYQDLWLLEDSMHEFGAVDLKEGGGLPSDTLFEVMIRDSHIITEQWTNDVISHHTTTHYATRPRQEIYDIANWVISELGKWIIHPEKKQAEIWRAYRRIGQRRKAEGYRLAEVISALSLTRKHIFAHVLAQEEFYSKPFEVFRIMEFMTRVNLFYDKAAYHIARGYEVG